MSSAIFPPKPSAQKRPTIKSKYEKSNKKSYINSLSAIPMFDMNKYSGREFYKTSYSQQYPERSSSKLNNSIGSDACSSDSSPLSQSFNYDGLSYADQYRIKKITGELNTQETGFLAQNYRRPTIPPHIKRDDCFQSNSERNIAFLHTVYGKLEFSF
jgi:hypothetical protein